jgi:UrcA family protein
MFIRSHRAVLALCGASLLATAGLAAAAPALAQSDDAPSIHVSYADLNLGSRDGAKAMIGRIDDAASRVCGGPPDMRLLDARAYYWACKGQAVERAVRQLDAPLVTAMAGLPSQTQQFARR